MNQEQIIQMAQEAGIRFRRDVFHSGYCDGVHGDELEAFAKLVAEHERSECLKFCDQVAEYFPSSGFVGSFIGSKIRDRGQA